MLIGPTVKKAARAVIVGRTKSISMPEKGRFDSSEVDEIVDSTWLGYQRLAVDLPEARVSIGNVLLLHLACLTLSCFEVLLKAEFDRERAAELVGDIAWQIYRSWGRLPRLYASLCFTLPGERMEACVRAFLRFPFSPPGYRFVLSSQHDGISVDMHRCQISEFFRAHGATDLCVASWCNLDFALARMWGGWLERTDTLAEGCAACNFRFRTCMKESNPRLSQVPARNKEARTFNTD